MPQPATPARALRRAGWLVGLLPLAGIAAATLLARGPDIAAGVAERAERIAAGTATATGEPWLRVSARGRDLVAQGEAPDVAERAVALAELAALAGPRRIVSELGLVETVAPFQWAATRTGGASVTIEGSRPVEIGRRALEVEVTGALGAGTRLHDGARAARGAPPDFPAAAAFLAGRLAHLAPGARATLNDTVLGLSGEALDLPAYDALRAALARPPEGYSVGRIEILPPKIADYRLAILRGPTGIALEGYVPTEAARRAALDAAGDLAGDGTVDDRLRTARGLPEAVEPGALIGFIGRLAALIQAGRVAYADGAVSVTGDAIDPQAIPEARALLHEGRPTGVAEGAASLAARPLSPYRVVLRRTPEAVTLTGHLPDEEARRRLLATLRARLYREPVNDRTRLAEGAPDGLPEALAAGVAQLSTLATGEVSLTDRTVRLTGESLYRESAARASERLAAALPAGWSGTAAVAPREPAERRDPESCREGAAAATATADLRFPAGSSALTPTFYPALDALATLAKACPDLRVAVSGPADPPGAKPAGPKPLEPAKAAEAGTTTQAKPPAKGRETHQDKAAAAHRPAAAAQDKAPEKPAEKAEDEPAGLARQRAQAVVDYLLQAGMRPAQVAAGPDRGAGPATVALLP